MGPRLTRRERQLLEAVVDGLSDREIADRLGVTHQTVRNALGVIYQKFHVRSRVQLAVLALRKKLVE